GHQPSSTTDHPPGDATPHPGPLLGRGGEGEALPKLAEGWARLMKRALRAKRRNIIGIGRLFHAAKMVLDYGEWTRIWKLKKSERPPVSKKTGDTYSLIGQEFGEADEKW